MATLRELKGRIGSVSSSEKITGAMKMISSAKMHKAEQALKRLWPYRKQIEGIIANLLSADARFSSPLLEAREMKHVGIVVLGSDDGLCGAYNMNILKQLLTRIQQIRSSLGDDVTITVFAVGGKIAKAADKIAVGKIKCRKTEGIDSKTEAPGVKRFVAQLREAFLSGEIDAVNLLYMNYKSAGRQYPRFEQFLPVAREAIMPQGIKASNRPYLFEPDANSIFTSILPLFLNSTMQEVFIENRASEQAARVMAMQSANDNAKKLLDQLQLEYNKLRQASITTELLDIIGGQVK